MHSTAAERIIGAFGAGDITSVDGCATVRVTHRGTRYSVRIRDTDTPTEAMAKANDLVARCGLGEAPAVPDAAEADTVVLEEPLLKASDLEDS